MGDLKLKRSVICRKKEKGLNVLRSEILAAISEMNEGKAVRVDEIPVEVLNSLGKKALKEVCDILEKYV